MKVIVLSVLLLLNQSVMAASAQHACTKRILNYQTSITGAAEAILTNFRLAGQAGDVINNDDRKIIAVAHALIGAVTKLSEKGPAASFAQGEIMLLGRVCLLKTFSEDTVGEVLERSVGVRN